MKKSIVREILKEKDILTEGDIFNISSFLYHDSFIKTPQIERIQYIKKLSNFIMTVSFGLPIEQEEYNPSNSFIKSIDGIMSDLYSSVPKEIGVSKEEIANIFKLDYQKLLEDVDFLKSYIDYNYDTSLNFIPIPLLRRDSVSEEFKDCFGFDSKVFSSVCKYMMFKKNDFSEIMDLIHCSRNSRKIIKDLLEGSVFKVSDVLSNNVRYTDDIKDSLILSLCDYFKNNKSELVSFMDNLLLNPTQASGFMWLLKSDNMLKILDSIEEHKHSVYKITFYNDLFRMSGLHADFDKNSKKTHKTSVFYDQSGFGYSKDFFKKVSLLNDSKKTDLFLDVVSWLLDDKSIFKIDKIPRQHLFDGNPPYIFSLLFLLEIKNWGDMSNSQSEKAKGVFSKVLKRLTYIEWSLLLNDNQISPNKYNFFYDNAITKGFELIGLSYKNKTIKMNENETKLLFNTMLGIFHMNKLWVTDADAIKFFNGLENNFGFDCEKLKINLSGNIPYQKFKSVVEKKMLSPVVEVLLSEKRNMKI